MHKQVIILLFIFAGANGMEKYTVATAVHSYLLQKDNTVDKRQPYLKRLQNEILLGELRKAPWRLLDNNKAFLDHDSQRFYVAVNNETVLSVFNLVHASKR